MTLVTDVLSCTGCRMCELACSFHHNGVFSPELSYVKVALNNLTGDITVTIDEGCDDCHQCLENCRFGVLEAAK